MAQSAFDTRRKTVGARSNARGPFAFRQGMHPADYAAAQRRLGNAQQTLEYRYGGTAPQPVMSSPGEVDEFLAGPGRPTTSRFAQEAARGTPFANLPAAARRQFPGGEAQYQQYGNIVHANRASDLRAALLRGLVANPAQARQTPAYEAFRAAGQQMLPEGFGQRPPIESMDQARSAAIAGHPSLVAALSGRGPVDARAQLASSMPMGREGFMPDVPVATREQPRFLGVDDVNGGGGSRYRYDNSRRPTGGGVIFNTRPPLARSNTAVEPGIFGGARLVGEQFGMDAEERESRRSTSLETQRRELAPYIRRRDAVKQFKKSRLEGAIEGLTEGRLANINDRRAKRGKGPLTRAIAKEDSGAPAQKYKESLLKNELAQRAESLGLPERPTLAEAIAGVQDQVQGIYEQYVRGDRTVDEAQRAVSKLKAPAGTDPLALWERLLNSQQEEDDYIAEMRRLERESRRGPAF